MPTPAFNERDYINAWNTHSAAKVAEHYATNAEVIAPEAPETLRGRDAIQKNVQSWMTAFPDVTGDIEMASRSGNNVLMLVHYSGTNRGALQMGKGQTIQPTNKKVEMPVGIFVTLGDDGKIVKERDVYNLAELLQQLAVPPETVSKLVASAGTRR